MTAAASGNFVQVLAAGVVDAGANAANDCVGGLLTFTGVVPGKRPSRTAGIVMRANVFDKSAQAGAYKLHLFDANPSASTFVTNGALSIHDNDIEKLIGVIAIGTAVAGVASVAMTTALDFVGMAFILAGAARDLYGIMTADGTPTFGGTTGILSVQLTVGQLDVLT